MGQFFLEHWEVFVVGAVTTVIGFLLKDIYLKIKSLPSKRIEEEKEVAKECFDEKIIPVKQEIEELRSYVFKNEDINKQQLALIVSSYKFRLSELCHLYIRRGHLTTNEFAQLQAFYEVYHGLGGNGPAEELYNKAIQLKIEDDI